MEKVFDISEFDKYKEDNRREVKKAKGGLPKSLWETYSAYANSYGGVIILGVVEREDKSWYTTGLKDVSHLLKDFWDTINNRKKVSINILNDTSVETYTVNDDVIMVIYVPRANREIRPVYIDDDMFKGTFKRTHEGDYHCTNMQVKAMLRDQTDSTMDMQVLDDIPMDYLCNDTVQSYRNRHRIFKPAHPWGNISDDEFLKRIGAAGLGIDGKLHPTAAGLLMFGEEYNIVRVFPEYFLDYREVLDASSRWSDRLESSSGEWTGNLFDFYFKVYNKIILNIKKPFKMIGGDRIDDTPVHKVLREVLANCLVNTDFYISRGVVIRLESEQLIIENPGSIRVGKYQMIEGGESDPRNKALMKMFNLIDIGERAGSGIPTLYSVWNDEGREEPIIEERLDGVERTKLIISFSKKKQAIKTSDKKASDRKQAVKSSDKRTNDKKQAIKTSDKKQAIKTADNMAKISDYLAKNGESKTADIAVMLDLSPARTRAILAKMDNIIAIGDNKNRLYKLK